MRLGVLTGGGDCAGINAVIRAAVKRATDYGFEVVGIRRGWAGLLEPDTLPLSYDDVAGILPLGGTVLLTSRTNPFKREGGPELVMKNVQSLGLDALLAIGGEDTLGVAHNLRDYGLKAVGAPKTIDNNLSETDFTFGFDSAVNVAMDAIDRIRTTGMSHERVMIVEVMGRDAGWVAAYAGIASGAHVILVPEQPVDIDKICEVVTTRDRGGKNFTLIVVAEGAEVKFKAGQTPSGRRVDEFGHPELGGIAHLLADEIENRTHRETRLIVLGHTLRGAVPSAFDRVLSSRLGVAAVDMVKQGRFDVMVALKGTEIVTVDLESALKPKKLDLNLLKIGQIFT
ncbi:MAG: ATP-dependent 6-phosphofructokinase [Thaumarchaeota archaeon]|nr:ATP-dependent 6-phosphofructokinase [Nitrososphaerota archaeon]MCL5317282.1 ATP-dependent 6-phosphofructokinase [Nitrososphaerota archaeon]